MAKPVPTPKIVLLLSARAGAEAPFRERFAILAAKAGPSERWSLQLDASDRVHVPHMDIMQDVPPHDAVVEFIGVGLDAAEPVATRIVDELRPLLDASRSNAAVIDEYAITQGDGPVFCVLTLRRYPTMDRATFMEAWFGRHAQLGAKVEGVRYRQNHAELASSAALAARLGLTGKELDGMALSYFVDPAEAVQILGSPAVAVGAVEDERRFIDHPRSQFSLYRTIGYRGPDVHGRTRGVPVSTSRRPASDEEDRAVC